jgi:CRISPR-associated endoribonuclease Cas6
MLVAASIQLEAVEAGQLREATGRLVHGFWFHHWGQVAAEQSARLHAGQSLRPFTLSPLLGLPHSRRGEVTVKPGQTAWFRVTTLEPTLSDALRTTWLARLPEVVTLGEIPWRVTGYTLDSAENPWLGQADPQALAEQYLLASRPAHRWRLRFATPTAFHGAAGHLPFPLPGALVGSWLRQWQAFGQVRLPEDFPEHIHAGLVISAYQLKTVPVRDRQRITIGCVGTLTLRATKLSNPLCAAVDLLAHYALWAGSGHRTTQGHGMTRLLRSEE